MGACFLWLINKDSTPKGPYDGLPSSPPTDFKDPEVQSWARDQFKFKSPCWHFNRFNRVTMMKLLRNFDDAIVKWKAANPNLKIATLRKMPNNVSTLKLTKDVIVEFTKLLEKALEAAYKCPSQDMLTDYTGRQTTFADYIKEGERLLDVFKPMRDALS